MLSELCVEGVSLPRRSLCACVCCLFSFFFFWTAFIRCCAAWPGLVLLVCLFACVICVSVLWLSVVSVFVSVDG